MSDELKSNNGSEAQNEEEIQKGSSSARVKKYKLYVVKPEDITLIWES